MPEQKISNKYIDFLKEIGTVGTGNAATALSSILNTFVSISLPQIKVLPLESLGSVLGNPDDTYFVMDVGLEGDIEGRIFFLLSSLEAKILGANLLNINPEEIDIEDLLFQSSLKETANILSCAYMNALSEMTDLYVICNVPTLAVDTLKSLLDFFFVHISQHSNEVMLLKTQLKVKEIDFSGFFLFFPNETSLQKISKKFNLDS